MVCLLNAYSANSDKVFSSVEECRRLKIPVLPPSVNASKAEFAIEEQEDGADGVRFGLATIKNVGVSAVEPLLAARREEGPFKSIEHMCRQADLTGLNPAQVADGVWSLPAVTPTDQVGIWTIEREGAPDIAFSVQLDPSESDLMRMFPDEVAALHPGLHVVAPGESTEAAGTDEEPARGELWRWLAALCLVALVLESLFGAWIGHKRRLA